MAVPTLDQIIDVCAFNVDLDKITGYLCQQDISNEATEIRDDSPELPPHPIRGGFSPVKEGKDAQEKLLLKTIKRNHVKLLAIYETWKTRVNAWIKNAEKAQGSDSSAGKKGVRLRSPWAARA